jgi:hypothetical protein
MELKQAIHDFLEYSGRGGIVLTAAGREVSIAETNDLITAYEKHVIHVSGEYIMVTEKPKYTIIESKDY